jgi:hypothetical protein
MFEAQIAKGVEYLDQDLGRSWPNKITLEELDLTDCCYCIIGQIYGDFWDKFHFSNHAVPFGFSLDCYLPHDRAQLEYKKLTQEWKEKIAQLRAERAN